MDNVTRGENAEGLIALSNIDLVLNYDPDGRRALFATAVVFSSTCLSRFMAFALRIVQNRFLLVGIYREFQEAAESKTPSLIGKARPRGIKPRRWLLDGVTPHCHSSG